MAYEKQTWDTTSFVNPTRMNHIENGIKDIDNRVPSSAVGSATQPVYINANGVPTACTSYANATVKSAGTCTGNAATATKATQDKNGKDITTQYATAAALANVFKGATMASNLNSLNAGTYVFDNNATNRPSGMTYGMVICLKNPDVQNYTIQIAVSVNDKKLAFRGAFSGTWQGWTVI